MKQREGDGDGDGGEDWMLFLDRQVYRGAQYCARTLARSRSLAFVKDSRCSNKQQQQQRL